MQIRTKNKVYTLAMTAMMAAVIAAVSPFAIPIGPTPITLCTLALYFSPYILGWKRAALATLVYILLGMVGIPVFSGFKAAEYRDPYHPQQDVDQRGQGGPFPAQDIGGEVEGQGTQGDGCGADGDGEGADCGDNRRHHSGHGQRVNLVFCSDLHSEGQPFYSKIVNYIF